MTFCLVQTSALTSSQDFKKSNLLNCRENAISQFKSVRCLTGDRFH